MESSFATPSSGDVWLDRSLGDLTRSAPGVFAVPFRHGLDFCCGGKTSLRAALGAQWIDVRQRIGELPALADNGDGPADDWLIEQILSRFPQRHGQQLPEWVELSSRVEPVHAERAECPQGGADQFGEVFQELESRMQKEVQILIPMSRSGGPPTGLPPVLMMCSEHVLHSELLARMVALAHRLEHPQGAFNSWRALLAGLRIWRTDLMWHIHLKKNLLFEGLTRPEAGATFGCRGGLARCGRPT